MLRKFFYLPFIVGFIALKNDKTPPDVLEQLVDRFYSFYSQYPQQKMYIQTDRQYYLGGDDLYGKIYLVNENSGAEPDSLRSKKIYVELINEENTVVRKAIVNGLYSSLNFSFHLPDSLADGNYLLRAYTAWMIHYSNNNVFSTYIHIANKTDHIDAALSYKDSSLSTVVIQLRDTLKNAFANQSVDYRLLYKDRIVAKNEMKTDAKGKFALYVNAIPKQYRNQAALKIKIGDYEKLLLLPASNQDVDVQFLPEGGNLVNDIDNNVAFKAVDQQGHGIDVDGYIEDNNKTIVCRFKSRHLGMGQFNFTPRSRRSYTAFIKVGGKEYKYPLDLVNDYAYQVSVVKRTNDALTVRVALGDSLYQKNKTSYLIATARGNVYFTSRGNDLYEVAIPLKKAPVGITQLTLFDEAMHPVSERLVYVSHPQPTVQLSADKGNYKEREKVTLQLTTKDVEGKSLPGFYALSVTDDHLIKPDENAANIKTRLLLSPYLKGYIEEPGYYFKADDSTTQNELDLVMLTHGWSRLTWQNIVDDKMAVQPYVKDSSLSISGTLLDKKNTPLSQYRISVFSKSDNTFIGTDTTNEKGGFFFPGIDFTDSTSFFIQIKNPKGVNEEATVVINPQSFPLTDIEKPVVPKELAIQNQTGINSYVSSWRDSLRDNMLKEVIVTTTRRKVDYDESKRVSAASYVIPRKTIEEFNNRTLMDLMYLIPGATFVRGHVNFYGPGGGFDSANPVQDPLVIVDGIESVSSTVDLHDVDFVEVLRGNEAAVYGVRGGNGVIIVNTKKVKESPVYFAQNGIKTLQVPGYQVEREFYAPKYESDESRLSKNKDERITLYWNGHINTDAKGTATTSFYTADTPTTYTVTLEGITQTGEYIHQTFPINRTGVLSK